MRSDRAAALLAVGTRVVAAFAAEATATATTTATLTAVIALAELAALALGPAAFGRAARTGLAVAGTVEAALVAAATAAVTAAAVTEFAVAVTALLAGLLGRAGRRIGAAEETLEPGEETTGGLGLGGRLRTRLLRALVTLLATLARCAGLERTRLAALGPEGRTIIAARLGTGFPALGRALGFRGRKDVELGLGLGLRRGGGSIEGEKLGGRSGGRGGRGGGFGLRSDGFGSGRRRGRRHRGGDGSGLVDNGRGHGRLARERILVLALRGDHLDGAGLVARGGGVGGCGGGAGTFAAGKA